jgi:hypothetical protein
MKIQTVQVLADSTKMTTTMAALINLHGHVTLTAMV